MFQLIAEVRQSVVRDFGKAVLDMLKKQYPDQTIDVDPASVGNKMLAIARKQNQYNDDRSMDAIQDFLTYLIRKNWNFAKDFPKWEDALGAIYSNIRLRAMSKSMEYTKGKKKTKGIEEAYGKRPEGGGTPEGGEARMPTDPASSLGKALDDKTAIKQFVDLIDEHLPELRATLAPDARILFDLIMDENIGSFGSDIKENMGQASALKDLLTEGEIEREEVNALSPEDPKFKTILEAHPPLAAMYEDLGYVPETEVKKVAPDMAKGIKYKKYAIPGTGRQIPGYPNEQSKKMYETHAKRWAGYIGDLRKKLLDQLWSYIDSHMTQDEYEMLRDMFFSDVDPSRVREQEKKKIQDKKDYQRGIDERKIARFKWQEQQGPLPDKDKKSFEALKAKLKKEGVDVDAIAPDQNPGKGKEEGEPEAQVASLLARVLGSPVMPSWA